MTSRSIPATPEEFFLNRLAQLPQSARLIIALDPEHYLNLTDRFTDPNGSSWLVFPYSGDDLAFRVRYSASAGYEPRIVWVTRDEDNDSSKIDLSYLADIIARAEGVIDLSLAGVLAKLERHETWLAETLKPFAPLISQNLARFISAYYDLRQQIGKDTPLSNQHFRAISLAATQDDFELREFLFEETEPSRVLRHYLRLAWTGTWEGESQTMLRDLARGSRTDTSEINAWLQTDPNELALYVYLRSIVARYRIANPANQLRGLRLFSLDPSELEKHAKIANDLLKDKAVAITVERIAETRLTESILAELGNILIPTKLAEMRTVLREEKAPSLVYALATRYLIGAVDSQFLSKELTQWQPRSDAFAASSLEDYSRRAHNALSLINYLSFIEKTLATEPKLTDDLGKLVDVFIERKTFALELAHARARQNAKMVGNSNLSAKMETYFDEQHIRIREHLEKIDRKLAEIIKGNWREFVNHPRLSIYVLRNLVITPLSRSAKKPRVWVLIFDGMRLDTWFEVVRPALSEYFEISEQKEYYSPLPSFTDIARVSMLAGHLPHEWKDYRGNWTSDHNILASRLFGLGSSEGRDKLRIIVNSETDYGQRRLDQEIKPFNILFYNLSDNWIHHFTDDVQELNETILRKVREGIIPDLRARIDEGDLVVVSSDHGFMELRMQDQIPVKYIGDEDKNPVVYRYLFNLEHEAGFKVPINNDFYTVAIGQQWFQRKGGRFSRYAHGGISMAEMIVPGAVLKRIAVPEVTLVLELPRDAQAVEREENTIIASLANLGNRAGDFALKISASTGETSTFESKLHSKEERTIEFHFVPVTQQVRITYQLTYRDAKNKTQVTSQTIPVQVKLRTDVVELGGLDALDRLTQE